METKQKAKRQIKSMDFSGEGSAVALVGPSVQGAANGFKTLVLKSQDTTDSNIETVLEELQVKVRKKRTLKESETAVAPVVTTESDNSTTNACVEVKVEPSGSVINKQGELQVMTLKVDATEVQEVVSDALVEVQKALNEQKEQAETQKVELQKALAEIAQYKEAQKASIAKAKTDKVAAVIKNVEHQAIIAKACLELESEEDFSAFMAAMTAMQAQVGMSEMFVEKGLQSSADKPETESALTKSVKALVAAK